jgi:TRAP-type C4-dicarboxylate transport system permease small subunit
MDTFRKIIEWVSEKLRMLGGACLIGMTVVTCVDVVGRFFRHPIFGSVEIVGFMATLAVAMALPYTDKMKGHVGVEIVVRTFSARTQAVIDLCTRILGLGVFGMVTWRIILYAYTMQKSGEVSISLEMPEHLIVYATSFCFLILTLNILQDVIDHIERLRNR